MLNVLSEMARGNGRRPGGVQRSPIVSNVKDNVANTSMKIEDFFEVHIKGESFEIKAEPLSPVNTGSLKVQKENVPDTVNSNGDTRTRKRAAPKKKTQPKKEVIKAVDLSKEKFITDYFQPRRSHRRTKNEVLKSKQMLMEQKIIHGDETGFEVVEFEGKGRGVVAQHDLKSGDFILEYAGDLINVREAHKREEMYAKDTTVGCYMYYFQHENNNYCVDATQESNRLGRLINHSIKCANLKTKSVSVGGKARLIFLAKKDIASGEELLYDYGDRDKRSLQSHPWLKN